MSHKLCAIPREETWSYEHLVRNRVSDVVQIDSMQADLRRYQYSSSRDMRAHGSWRASYGGSKTIVGIADRQRYCFQRIESEVKVPTQRVPTIEGGQIERSKLGRIAGETSKRFSDGVEAPTQEKPPSVGGVDDVLIEVEVKSRTRCINNQ